MSLRCVLCQVRSTREGEHREQAERLAALAVEKLGNLSLSFINLKSLKSRACALSNLAILRDVSGRDFFGVIVFFFFEIERK